MARLQSRFCFAIHEDVSPTNQRLALLLLILLIQESQSRKAESESKQANIHSESPAILRLIVSLEDLCAIDGADVGGHDNPTIVSHDLLSAAQPMLGEQSTYIAIARDLFSGSRQVNDIQVMFNGCGKFAKICVQITPK